MQRIALCFATLAMVSTASGCGADPKPPQPAGAGEKRTSAVDEKAPSNEAPAAGHWICIEHSRNGEPVPAPESIHALFTDREVKLSSSLRADVFEYHFDTSQTPKRCDLLTRPKELGFYLRAIYSLDDGKLRLCIPVPATTTGTAPYPVNLEPGKGREIYTFKHVEKEAGANEASFSAQEKEVLAGQRTEIAENVKRLEEKKYSEFAEHFFPPEARDAMKQRPNRTEEMLKLMEERGPLLAKLLRTLSTDSPTFNADCSRGRRTICGRSMSMAFLGANPYLRKSRRSLVHGRTEPKRPGQVRGRIPRESGLGVCVNFRMQRRAGVRWKSGFDRHETLNSQDRLCFAALRHGLYQRRGDGHARCAGVLARSGFDCQVFCSSRMDAWESPRRGGPRKAWRALRSPQRPNRPLPRADDLYEPRPGAGDALQLGLDPRWLDQPRRDRRLPQRMRGFPPQEPARPGLDIRRRPGFHALSTSWSRRSASPSSSRSITSPIVMRPVSRLSTIRSSPRSLHGGFTWRQLA